MPKKLDPRGPRKKREVRIEYLEKLARSNLYSLGLLASLGELQHDASLAGDPSRILSVSADHLQRLLDFQVLAYFRVDEESSEFVLAQVEPPDQKENIQKEIDLQIENDSFAYAINQNQPVVLRSSVYGQSLILHVLATKKRVRGMFAGVLAPGARKLNETVLYPLSIILQNTANALEGAALYQMISEQNKNLEEIVRQRTKALEEQTRELKEEIAYRRLAEESLMVAKEEAEAAARVKSEFIANISHEFRTPLNGILGYAEILLYEARQLSRPDLINDLKAIESAGRHLLGLINDTLDLSKIQAGKMDLHFESFRVVDLIEDVMKTIRPLARKNENQLEVTCQGQVQSMISDKVRVRQVLLNLLSNACKFTEKGTVHLKISVRTVDGSDWIYFMVSDTGIGISPDKVDTLFQEFCQAETGPRKYGGTGLGLAISQRLCHMLGGDISVSSEVGRGSIFTISLPADASQAEISRGAGKTELAGPRISPLKVKNMVTRPSLDEEPEPEPELEPASPETSPKTPGTDRPKVLVIDDDPIVRDLVWRILEKEGWGVETAAQGEEGLRRAREFQPDLITLDVMMPEMDGWTVLRKLKEDPHLASIPVLMLTLVEEKDKALELGASAFLSKPLQWQVFVETVQQFWKKPDAGPPPAEVVPPILVVEDDLTNRDALCRLLRKEGWNVEEARDGQEALEILETVTPRLILLDLVLPDLNGFDFLSRLRQDPRWRSVPILILTAKELSKKEKGRLYGDVDRIFQKGDYTRTELLEEIRQLTGETVSN